MSQQINLFNPIFRKKGFSFTSANAMLYGVAIAAACAGVGTVYERNDLRVATAEAKAVEELHKNATNRFEKLTADVAQQKPNAELEADVARMDAQLKGRQEIMETLKSGVVGNTEGFSEYMRAFSRQSVNGLWMTGFDLARGGNDAVIQGRALSADLVATYINQLNREKSLQGMQFSALRIGQPKADPANQNKDTVDSKGEVPAPKTAADAKSAPVRYLEFTVSTNDIVEDAKPADKTAGTSGAVPLPMIPNAVDNKKTAFGQEAPR